MTEFPDHVSISAGSPDAPRPRGVRGARLSASTGDEHHNPWLIGLAVIGAIATLLASLGGLVFSALTWRQATDAQTSERFSRSTEQLGSDSIAMRVGAVYSFARLMRDSEADREAIVEVLSSFVAVQADQAPPLSANEETRPVPADLSAAMKTLGESAAIRPSSSPSMSLIEVDLSGYRLQSLSMPRADLYRADLTGANLYGPDLTGTLLIAADLPGANLTDADLTGANLYDADLTGADLLDADLTGADLTGADLTGADLTGADLFGADLTGADLTNDPDRRHLLGDDQVARRFPAAAPVRAVTSRSQR